MDLLEQVAKTYAKIMVVPLTYTQPKFYEARAKIINATHTDVIEQVAAA